MTLIDTGPNHPATWSALREALSARGLTFQDLDRLIVTHAHVDHFGLAAHIVAAADALVLSHASNRWWLTEFEHEIYRRSEFYDQVFAQSGAPGDLAETVRQWIAGMMRYATAIPANRFVPLEDGDTLVLGADTWRVIYAPGHASGLICLYEPRSHTLISSDHLLRDITSNPVLEPPPRGESERPRALINYLASLHKIASLDVRNALPAHGEPIVNVHALVAERLAFHRARLEQIEQQLRGGRTAYELCHIFFPNLTSVDVFLGLSEIIGHLDVLELEGRVHCEMHNGLVHYVTTSK